MSKRTRSKLFVDRRIQGTILLRTLLYWVLCVTLVSMLILCGRISTGPSLDLSEHLDHLFAHYRWAFIAALIVLPLIVTDTMRFSNRVVGPLLRLRRAMTKLAEGGITQSPISVRQGDYCDEIVRDFNRLLTWVQQHADADEADELAGRPERPRESRPIPELAATECPGRGKC